MFGLLMVAYCLNLEEWKYVQEKIKFENHIDEELDSDSDNDE